MTPERWQQIRAAFDEALRLEGAARAAHLASLEADAELHREVLSLLKAEEAAEGFLDTAAPGPLGRPAPQAELPRAAVGPYTLVRELGHGGMGTVYEATRSGDFAKKVALKIVRRGMDTDFILERFRTERQILAALEHPNIAQLLDGGTTDDGLPYFVMSFVDGEPIDRYCERLALDTPARLALFRQVCDAVDYAHRSLVVHRDLKPANILVDRQGVPRLLDFGIAKLLAREGAEHQATTAAELRLLTPEYASPEQVKGERVTTASDVYSLGVLLHELLTGRRPYRLEKNTTDEQLRAVVDQQAQPPSTVKRGLAGDLDTIVLKALRKEPERRYASVERLSDDLRRYLEGLPVSARKETLGYLAGKFVRRNRGAVAAAGVVLLSLVGGIVATTVEARAARRQQARADAARASAEALIDFMVGDLRKKLEPTSRLEVMDGIALEAQAYFDGLPPADRTPASDERRASVFAQLATVRLLEGKAPEADAMSRASLALYEQLARTQPPGALDVRLAEARDLRGRIAEEKGDAEAALAEYRTARELWERAYPRKPDDESAGSLANACNDEGRMLYALGKRDEARAAHGRARAVLEALSEHARSTRGVGLQLSSTLLYLGRLEEDAGELAEATTTYRQARDLGGRLLAAAPKDTELAHHTAVLSDDLCRVQRLDGHYDASEEDGARALAMLEELVARDPANGLWRSDLSSAHSFLGRVRELRGKLAEALLEFRADAELMEQLSKQEPANGIYKSGLSDALTNVGRAQRALGALAEAQATHRRALALREELLAATPGDAWAEADVGEGLLELGRDQAAARDAAGAQASWKRGAEVLAEVVKTSDLARHRSRYAQVLLELGELDRARPVVEQLLKEHHRDPFFLALAKKHGFD